MPRTSSRPRILVSIACCLLAAGCASTPPEEQLLTNFFRAARLRDNTTLANIAAVTFDPRTRGSVQQFDVVSTGPEQRRTLQIRELIEQESRARAEGDAAGQRKRTYQDANLPALERVAKAQRAGQSIKGADIELVTAWTKVTEEESQAQRKLSQIGAQLASERAAAVASLTPPGRPDIDVSGMDVDVITKQMTLDARVRTPDGQTMPQTLVATMQRAVGRSSGQTREGRWILVALQSPAVAAAAG